MSNSDRLLFDSLPPLPELRASRSPPSRTGSEKEECHGQTRRRKKRVFSRVFSGYHGLRVESRRKILMLHSNAKDRSERLERKRDMMQAERNTQSSMIVDHKNDNNGNKHNKNSDDGNNDNNQRNESSLISTDISSHRRSKRNPRRRTSEIQSDSDDECDELLVDTLPPSLKRLRKSSEVPSEQSKLTSLPALEQGSDAWNSVAASTTVAGSSSSSSTSTSTLPSSLSTNARISSSNDISHHMTATNSSALINAANAPRLAGQTTVDAVHCSSSMMGRSLSSSSSAAVSAVGVHSHRLIAQPPTASQMSGTERTMFRSQVCSEHVRNAQMVHTLSHILSHVTLSRQASEQWMSLVARLDLSDPQLVTMDHFLKPELLAIAASSARLTAKLQNLLSHSQFRALEGYAAGFFAGARTTLPPSMVSSAGIRCDHQMLKPEDSAAVVLPAAPPAARNPLCP